MYAVAVDLKRVLDLSEFSKSRWGEAVRKACLNEDDLSASMEVGSILVREGIQGLLFPSVIGGDDNLIVYRANCTKKSLTIHNEKEVIEEAERIAQQHGSSNKKCGRESSNPLADLSDRKQQQVK